jgi:hypothetical protein
MSELAPLLDHCWHRTGFCYGDGRSNLKCCHCGETCFESCKDVREEGHGPHHPHPVKEVKIWPAPTQCPARIWHD